MVRVYSMNHEFLDSQIFLLRDIQKFKSRVSCRNQTTLSVIVKNLLFFYTENMFYDVRSALSVLRRKRFQNAMKLCGSHSRNLKNYKSETFGFQNNKMYPNSSETFATPLISLPILTRFRRVWKHFVFWNQTYSLRSSLDSENDSHRAW